MRDDSPVDLPEESCDASPPKSASLGVNDEHAARRHREVLAEWRPRIKAKIEARFQLQERMKRQRARGEAEARAERAAKQARADKAAAQEATLDKELRISPMFGERFTLWPL